MFLQIFQNQISLIQHNDGILVYPGKTNKLEIRHFFIQKPKFSNPTHVRTIMSLVSLPSVRRNFLPVTRYFLLVTLCFLLVTPYFLIVTRYILLVTRYISFVNCYFLVLIFYLLLFTRYSLLLTRYSLRFIYTVLHLFTMFT